MAGIAPWLSVKNATESLAYDRAAFGAIELERLEDEAGDVVVAELSIEGADFWIRADTASGPEALNGRWHPQPRRKLHRSPKAMDGELGGLPTRRGTMGNRQAACHMSVDSGWRSPTVAGLRGPKIVTTVGGHSDLPHT